VSRVAAFHLSAFTVLWIGCSRATFVVFVVTFYLRSLALSAGYHRYFAHRSFETSRAFQLLLAIAGSATGQKGPLTWATSHRVHHQNSDGPIDPHSPVHRGWFDAQIGWVLRKNSLSTSPQIESEFAQAPEIVFVNRHYYLGFCAYVGSLCLVGAMLHDMAGVLLWGGVMSTLVLVHTTGLINSTLHTMGGQPHSTGDNSRNLALLLPLALGESWHNNHHRYPSSANTAFRRGQIDPVFLILRGLAALRIVWNLRQPIVTVSEVTQSEAQVPSNDVSSRW